MDATAPVDPDCTSLGKVLVTGAAGFIGSALIRELQRSSVDVRALVRRPTTTLPSSSVECVVGDVRDRNLCQQAADGVDTIFHLAAGVHDLWQARRRAGDQWESTHGGTVNMLEAGLHGGAKRFVYMSSLAVYDASPERRDESFPCRPSTPYGQAKLAAEAAVLRHGTTTGTHVCCLRPAMVYGVGCAGHLPLMIRLIDRGVFPPPPEVGNKRSVTGVSNLVSATLLAATDSKANGQCYVVSDDRPLSTREMYDAIRNALGAAELRWQTPASVLRVMGLIGDGLATVLRRRMPFGSDAVDRLLGSAWFSADRIVRELGFAPRQTFVSALPAMIADYRARS